MGEACRKGFEVLNPLDSVGRDCVGERFVDQ